MPSLEHTEPERHTPTAGPVTDADVPSEEDLREDREDLECARTGETAEEEPDARPMWKSMGPGLITGAADDDPSGIGTYSVAGAQFGYGLLWLVPICVPLMIAVQEMCGRVGVITGKGLAAVLKEHYPRWVLILSVIALTTANVFNIYADLNVMAASARMLFGGHFFVWVSAIAFVLIATQILIPYRSYVRVLKWLCTALLAYVIVAFMPAVHKDWGSVAHNLIIPHWSKDTAFILTVVGFLGTTISPYLFFWQAGEEVEEEIAVGRADQPGHRTAQVTESEMRALRTDTAVGMLASQAITFCIMIATAATLHATGKTDINTAQDAARALLPLGPMAYWLFTIGILGTGMLAIPTLAGSVAYAVAESMGWKYGLYRRYQRARGFYITLGASVAIGYALNFVHAIPPLKALLYSAALNGVVAPPLIVVLLLICNNRKIVKDRKNGPISNFFGWTAAILMGIAASFLLWAMATGKAS